MLLECRVASSGMVSATLLWNNNIPCCTDVISYIEIELSEV